MTRRRRRGLRDQERGSAAVLGVGVVAGLVTVLVLTLGLVAVLVAGQQARTAADLGSLAAAGQLVRGADPDGACARAREIVREHGADLTRCAVSTQSTAPWAAVTVDVARPVAGTRWTVSVTARAGLAAARPTPN